MSKWGLSYKGVEILTPDDWNAVVDALNELDGRSPKELKGGQATFTGDGSTTSFQINHTLTTAPTAVMVGKASPNIPDIDYFTADNTKITIYLKSAPSSGQEVKFWWLALRL